MGGGSDLLERLCRTLDCAYLSELRQPLFQRNAIQLAARIEPEDYPLEQWRDAVTYLTGEARAFGSAAEARDYLGEWKKG